MRVKGNDFLCDLFYVCVMNLHERSKFFSL